MGYDLMERSGTRKAGHDMGYGGMWYGPYSIPRKAPLVSGGTRLPKAFSDDGGLVYEYQNFGHF